jgi:hypothetical protein
VFSCLPKRCPELLQVRFRVLGPLCKLRLQSGLHLDGIGGPPRGINIDHLGLLLAAMSILVMGL